MFNAILSSPIGFAGQTINFKEVAFPTDLSGIISYVGHPSTKELLAGLGAEYVGGKYMGCEVGESYLAVPLADNKREGGYTNDAAIDSVKSLKAILCTRVA